MNTYLLLLTAIFLSACHAHSQQRLDVMTYRQTQQISHDEEIVNWRDAHGIPLQASIAITQNNNIAILQENTRPYIIAPSMNPYINDFAPCYLRREAFIAGKHVLLEVPCQHRPANDENDSIFNHRSGSPFPGAQFDVNALYELD